MNKSYIYMVVLTMFAISSCKKEDPQNPPQPSNEYLEFCQHISAHNVLKFEKYKDVAELEDFLEEKEKDFPYNRGNEAEIRSKLQGFISNGWTSNEIDDFNTLLDDSYPLSDDILIEIIQTHDQVTPSFAVELLVPVFEKNASLSPSVFQELKSSAIPQDIKQQMLLTEENTVMTPNHAYDDFLSSFPGYKSLYAEMYEREKKQLEAGMDPADPFYNNDVVKFDFERLLLNVNREIYIKDALYKMYDSCRAVVFQNNLADAYADLSIYEGNGGVFKQPNIEETQTGIALSVMNNSIPVNMAIINPDRLPLFPSTDGDDTFVLELDALSAGDLKEKCPLSVFYFDRDTSNALGIQFESYTDLNYPNQDFVQYWNFGDGTGSFQENPYHVFPQAGSYIVKLTTFSEDCECWDVKTIEVFVGEIYLKGCYSSLVANWTLVTGEYDFFAQGGDDNNSPVTGYTWDFGDGTVITTAGASTTHVYSSNGDYEPTVTISFANGCSATSEVNQYTFIRITDISDPNCCDQERNKYKETDIDIFDDGQHRLKIKDKANTSNWGLYFDKMRGTQVFYIKKSNGGWKKQKAEDQIIRFTGSVTLLNDGECSSAIALQQTNENRATCEDCKKEKLRRVNFPQDWGLSENSLVYTHFVRYNGLEDAEFVYFGKPCD